MAPKIMFLLDRERMRFARVRNTKQRFVVLNRIARSVIEEARGMHPVYVFVRRSKDGITVPVKKRNNTGWRSARERAADAWELPYRAHR
jgi:hypothetical protein